MKSYTILSRTLSAQAEAIRNLMGTDQGLTPEEMTTQLRQAGEVMDHALETLKNKGVDTTDAQGLPQLPQLIEAIPADGEPVPPAVCTVILRHEGVLVGGYTVCPDGSAMEAREIYMDSAQGLSDGLQQYILEQVVCGSSITLTDPQWILEGGALPFEIGGSAVEYSAPMEGVLIFQAPQEPDEVCVITFQG